MDVGRLHRVLRLVTILQSGAAKNSSHLAEELGISRRTFFRDLKMLEAAGIPYFYENGKGYYIAPSFFLPPINLKVSEAMGLMVLAKSASANRQQPLIGAAIDAIGKLISMIPASIRDVCNEMMSSVTVRPPAIALVDGDTSQYTLLQQCIDEKRVVSMRYNSLFDNKTASCNLRPYHLHYAVHAWYVIGYCEHTRQIRTYKLASIDTLKSTSRTFTMRKSFDINAYLGKAWQLIPEGKLYQVDLEFSDKVGNNVSEVRWHPTQKHKLLPDGRCKMSFEVDGLNEITWWLLGYGDQVIVHKPIELQQRLQSVYREALACYEGRPTFQKLRKRKRKGNGKGAG